MTIYKFANIRSLIYEGYSERKCQLAVKQKLKVEKKFVMLHRPKISLRSQHSNLRSFCIFSSFRICFCLKRRRVQNKYIFLVIITISIDLYNFSNKWTCPLIWQLFLSINQNHTFYLKKKHYAFLNNIKNNSFRFPNSSCFVKFKREA